MKDLYIEDDKSFFQTVMKKIKKTLFKCCKSRKKRISRLKSTKPSLKPLTTKKNLILSNIQEKNRKNQEKTQKNINFNEKLQKRQNFLEKKENFIEKLHFIEKQEEKFLLSEAIEPKRDRFHLHVEEYPLNQLILAGRLNKQLLLKINAIKLSGKYEKKKDFFSEINDKFDKKTLPISENLKKYYKNRHLLFSKYDEGVKMDEEAWFSTTPEVIAEYVAKRIASGIVLDGFCGVGGNTIQFAKYCQKVIANDIDPLKIVYAKHNSRIYDIESKIMFINHDFLQLEIKEKEVDWVFLAPPWGGIDYSTDENYSLTKSITPNIKDILRKAFSIHEKIILCLPRNINLDETIGLIAEAAMERGRGIDRATIEVEKVFLNNKFKLNLVYFGNASKIARSMEFTHIYQRALGEGQKYDLKQKEFVKGIVEKIGMTKALNLAEKARKEKGIIPVFQKFCQILLEGDIIESQEIEGFSKEI